jgi:hypothetical protein
VCRPAAGVCDAAENCPGAPGGACPADQKQPTGTVCRAAVNTCDAAENCDGTTDNCPADAKQPNGTSCSNGTFCDGAETCQSGVCTNGSPPCPSTICSEAMQACLSSTCPATPQTCRTSHKGLLLIKNKTPDSKDKLVWKFIKGAQTTQSDLQDPRSTADYALCIYAGTANTLVGTINVPPSNSKWTVLGTKGYKFLDTTPFPDDGAKKILVKGGTAGKSKMLVKGAGANLPDPINGGPLSLPVTVQLFNYQTGACFNTTFTNALKNTTTLFKAKFNN